MKRLFANLVCIFVPSRKLRGKLRRKIIGDRRQDAVSNLAKDLKWALCRKISLANNGDVWTLPNGTKFYLPLYPWDSLQRKIADNHSFFEQDILERLREYVPKGATVLDIGANIGNHSVYWAAVCGARRCHAFEPIRETFRMLETNIKINNLEKIIVPHNVGLGDKKSGGEIARTWADNIGGTSVRESRPGTMGELAIERLDDMGLDESRIDFCKIDVEGFEVKTLSGMRKTIERYKPVVFIEVFDETMPGTGMTAAELKANDTAVRKFFEGLGYEAPVSIPECNYLFVPRK